MEEENNRGPAPALVIAIIYNPASGGGRARLRAEECAARLREQSYDAQLLRCEEVTENAPGLGAWQAAIVIGGDGTVMRLLPALITVQCPVYVYPAGTENLFAKEFNHRADVRQILRSVLVRKVRPCDIGEINGRPFAVMASVGFDAEVVARVAELRRGPIGKRGYVLPVLRSLVAHRPPQLTVYVDGERVTERQSGYVIAANLCRYALGISLVPEARRDDGRLTVRFIPYSSPWFCLRALLSPRALVQFPVFEGRKVVVESESPAAVQTDGEFAGMTPAQILVCEQKLQVFATT